MTKKLLFTLILMASIQAAVFAQMPHDAIYMPKKTICIAATYTNSSWKQYWENTLMRENANMGTHTTQSFMPMAAIGITDKLNAIVALPYMTTSTSAGNLRGQKGLQDVSVWLKYKMIEKNGFSAHGVLGGSVPVGNYLPDFLPMSLGLQAKTATTRLLANYTHKSGMYATAHTSYILRSTIKINRDAYQAFEKVHNSNEVAVPNAIDATARVGYWKNGIQAEVFYEKFTCTSGDNIRRNDMPFPTNNMQATSIGFYGKYQPKNIGANVRISQVTSGLNVGESLSLSLGFLYQLNFTKK
jgi:hypothetical protein